MKLKLTPTPAFMQAAREILGHDDLIISPMVIIPALRDWETADRIRERYRLISNSPAGRAANSAIAESNLDDEGEATRWLEVYRANTIEQP
jgi:hypothetical protein